MNASSYVCRLLKQMSRSGCDSVTPRVKGTIGDEPLVYQNYIRDFFSLGQGSLNDNELEFR